MKRVLLSIVGIVWACCVCAQEKGYVRGNLTDGDFGGPLIGANVIVDGQPGLGTVSDFDGNYSLALEPGTYTINISFVSFETLSFPNTVVKAGETTIIDATLMPATASLEAVTVVAKARRNSEAAILIERKNAVNVTDGLSSQAFRKVGDGDLSGAIKRVTGVTIEGGKYVYVRGLGDRYTVTTLNGMVLPGLDPDVNSVQMDIFPTAALENVGVSKTFSPDLYGDFTGGLVNIVTKKFPDEKTTELSVGVTYVPSMHFNDEFILYGAGSLDWAGIDDGTRELPFDPLIQIPDESRVDPKLEEITRSFNQELATKKKTALPNGSFSFYHGNQINKESGLTFGYNAVLNYSNENIFYKDFQSNDYLKSLDTNSTELVLQTKRLSNVGQNNVVWSALVSGSMKKNSNSLGLTVLHSQSGQATASDRVNQDVEQNVSTLMEDVLTYTSRRLSSFILNGSHKIGKTEFQWANATTLSRVYDPDFRETRISVTDGDTTLSPGNGSGIDRFWRDLHELNEAVKVDFKIPLSAKFNLKTGAAGLYKTRDFEVYNYKLRTKNLSDIELDPDWFLMEDNYWSADPSSDNFRDGTYTLGNYQESNSFSASQTVFGAYVMAEHPIASVLKAAYGVRVEKADMYYTGTNQNGTLKYIDRKTLDALNVLPSINLVYQIGEKMNVRAGASRTVARPTFREKSIAQIYDPITKRTFIGNLDLEQTNVNNFDLRYEFFMSPKEVLSVSGFYKQFFGHIEKVAFPSAPDNITYRNSGDATVYGLEFEIRKNLGNTLDSTFISRFSLGANFSLVRSLVDLKSVIVDQSTGQTEYELRMANLRGDETLDETRPMAGQSPYAVNASITYEEPNTNTNISLAYNIQGEQLSIIASGRVPDVYTVPFHSLNFNAFRSFGKKQKSKITIGLRNILNDDRTLIYKSYKTDEFIYTTYKPGLGINIKYGYKF